MSTATTELMPRTSEAQIVRADDFMPLFQIDQAVARQKAMSDFIGKILKPSTPDAAGDYGEIPGASKQKVLLKPGAEKLCTFFGLTPMFLPETSIEDWTGTEHGGEPLFYYRYKCQLWRGDRLLAEAVGSCNSREKKYRFRNSERTCPQCHKATIIKGKQEYGGGFLCFAKKGGCGAKFSDNDPAIVGQEVGQVANPDIFDTVNTCQKMAQKRALVAAVLIGTNASDSFTQDIEEDLDHAPATQPGERSQGAQAGHPAPLGDPELQKLIARCKDIVGFDDVSGELCEIIRANVGPDAADKAWSAALDQYGEPRKKRGAWELIVRYLYNAAQTSKELAA